MNIIFPYSLIRNAKADGSCSKQRMGRKNDIFYKSAEVFDTLIVYWQAKFADEKFLYFRPKRSKY